MQTDQNPIISVVIPVFGCRECLHELVHRLDISLKGIAESWEIIMVNDGSPDGAWDTISELSLTNSRVKGINFSRNFGQHSAITAGLEFAKGDWIIVMDCDLQDQPEEIINLYKKALEGYDIVQGKRTKRRDTLLKKLSSRIFYKVFNYFTDTDTKNEIANFGIYRKKIIDSFLKLREQNRSFYLFINWLGFEKAEIEIDHSKRISGKSSYNLSKLLNLAFDNIISHSNKPLRLSITFGALLSLGSLMWGLFLFVRYFFQETPVQGWTSVMVSLFFIGGLLFANLGLIGLYMGKIFNETKRRPLFVIKDLTNFDEEYFYGMEKDREHLKTR